MIYTPFSSLTTNELISECISEIRKAIRREKVYQLIQNLKRREEEYATKQKKHNKSILERYKSFDGIYWVDDPISGSSRSDPDIVKTHTKKFYKDLFTPKNPKFRDVANCHDALQDLEARWVDEYNHYTPNQDLFKNILQPIDAEEFNNLLTSLSNNKAPGKSGITYDHIKLLSNSSKNIIRKMRYHVSLC
jgi:hypothetical protein